MKDSEGNFRTDVVLSDRDTHVPFSDKLRFVFLQLPCFKKEESECENDFERWIYVLKNMETLQRLPFKARKSVFEKLEQIVDIASLSKEERMKYDESRCTVTSWPRWISRSRKVVRKVVRRVVWKERWTWSGG